MSANTIKPVYDIQHLQSKSEAAPWTSLGEITGTMNEGWVVLWQHHGVFVGQITQGSVKWLGGSSPVAGDEHLVRLRAFDADHEFHFWRSSSGITGRVRLDRPGEGTDCIDTRMILRGGIAKPLQGAKTKPDPGEFVFDPDEPIALRTRNYIEYHPKTQQAGYVDCRFVDFYKKLN